MSKTQQLIAIEEQVARAVSGVRGYITKTEADLLWKLRLECGKKYDAVNGRWEALTSDDLEAA